MRHTNHTFFEIKGSIPPHVLKYLQKELGNKLTILEDEDLVNIESTGWYKETGFNMHPGDYIRIYRENNSLTQEELGKKLGALSRQYISDLEKGRREVSKELAKKLSILFDVPISRFIQI